MRLGATACRDRCTAHALHSRSVSLSLTHGVRVLLFLALPLFHCLLVQWRGWISRRSSRGDAKSESNDKIVGRKGSQGREEKRVERLEGAEGTRVRRSSVADGGGAPLVGRCHSTESPLCPRGSLTPVAQSAWLDFLAVFRRFYRARDEYGSILFPCRQCMLSECRRQSRSRPFAIECRRRVLWQAENERDAR